MLLRTLVGFACVLVGFVLPVSAQVPPPCTPEGYVVGYFNGVNNTKRQARKAVVLLKNNYGATYQEQPIVYEEFYNPTDGLLQDVAETFAQKEAESPEIRGRWELIWEIIRGGTTVTTRAVAANPLLRPVLEKLKDDVIFLIQDHTEELIEAALPEPVVERHVGRMNELLSERRKVLAIAHSQGNLFLNAVYDRVHPTLATESLKTVHIATPSATVRPLGGPYTTANIDLIIQAVRLVLASTLEPNVDLPPAAIGEDGLGHSFALVYMNPSYDALPVVKGDIDNQLASLDDPPCSPPPPSGFTTSLPAALAGVRVQDNNCSGPVSSATFGTMSFNASGTVTGSGCFESVEFPATSLYNFSQEPGGFSLRLIHPAGGRIEFLLARIPGQPHLLVDVDWPGTRESLETSLSGPLPINVRSRMLGWVNLVAGQPCTARFTEFGSSMVVEGAHIEAGAGSISVIRGAEVIATATVSDLLDGDLRLVESNIIESRFGRGHFAASNRLDAPRSLQVGLFDEANLPILQFSASLVLPSGTVTAVSCSSL